MVASNGASRRKRSQRPGRTASGKTPITIQSAFALDDAMRDDVRRRLTRKVGKFAGYVEQLSARFADAKGRDGAIDVVCRIRASLRALPSVVVAERAADAALALRRAADVLGRTLKRTLRHVGASARRPGRSEPLGEEESPGTLELREDDGSLVDRRVGHATSNMERALARPEKRRRDVFVDTAAPGTSASDRKAGYGATAARNTKRNVSGMQAALEDSRTKPSRKSTRRSTNRMKAATLLQHTAQLASHTPKVEATRARARNPSPT